MKRKLALMLGLAISAAVILLVILSGCSNTTGAGAAQTQPVSITGNQQGIWVNGEGKVTVTPDIATLSLGVTTQASTVAEAQSQAMTAMNQVMSVLISNGIDTKDIQTQNFNIQQINTPVTVTTPVDNNSSGTTNLPLLPPTPTPSLTIMFQVSNTVTVKIRNIDKTGSIIDSVVAAGGDLIRIDSVSFSVDQPEQYYAQARQLAIKDAADKASQLAKLAGVTLGKATYISENSYTPIYTPLAASGNSVASSVTSISPGQTDVTIDVQVAYAIQ